MIVLKEQIEQILSPDLPFNVVVNSNGKWSSIYLQTNCSDTIAEFKTYKSRLTRDERAIILRKIAQFLDFHHDDLALVLGLKFSINQEVSQVKENLTMFCNAHNLTSNINDWKMRIYDFDLQLVSNDKVLRLDYNCSRYDIEDKTVERTHPNMSYHVRLGRTPIEKSYSKTFMSKEIIQIVKGGFDLFEDIYQRQVQILKLKNSISELISTFKETCENMKW